jgi:hypothetical protein
VPDRSSRRAVTGRSQPVTGQQFRRDRRNYLNSGQAVGAKPAQLKAMVRSAQQSETGRPARQAVQAVRAQVVRQVGSDGADATMNPLTDAASKLARAARQLHQNDANDTSAMSGAADLSSNHPSPDTRSDSLNGRSKPTDNS